MTKKPETKTVIKILAAVFALYLLIHYWQNIAGLMSAVLKAAAPLIIGCVIAYPLNILMSFYERHFFPRSEKKSAKKLRRPLSLLLAIITLLAIIALVAALIVPQLISCVKLLIAEVPGAIGAVLEKLDKLNIISDDIADRLMEIDWQSRIGQIVKTLLSGIGSVVDIVVSVVSSVISGIVTAFVAVIFSVYLLMGKNRIGGQLKRLMNRYIPEKKCRRVEYIFSVMNDSLHRFIVGQCTEAVILGALCTLGMLILGLPYAPMIGAVTAFTALIPIVGAFIGGGIGAFLILMESPVKALIFVIFIIVLQQLEGNIIYPRVVGSSIGLPGIWVLTAVTIGGGVFGIFGMLLSVPLAASVYRLLRENVNKTSGEEKAPDTEKTKGEINMERKVILEPEKLRQVRRTDPRMMSYNIEMTEVTGGTFWKEYTPGQIAGTEEVPAVSGLNKNMTAMSELMQYYPPIDLRDPGLIKLTKALGPAWVRVSGSWATKTYYDLDNTTGGKAPDGYQSVLTKEQWTGVLDFVKETEAKLLISVSNCAGDHPDGGPLDLTQTKKIFDFSAQYGVPIDAAEFMNEPNMMEMSGAPEGYTPANFVRDQDIFNGWVRENYPDCIIVGPCTTGGIGDELFAEDGSVRDLGGIGDLMKTCTTDELMDGAKVPLDVFSYHYYNGISERAASLLPSAHWDASQANTDEYLAVAPNNAEKHLPLRDRYVPGGQIWVTESGDAGAGGDTWASTYLDVFRTLNELGSFALLTDGIIFHNTLASSDYGFLRHGTFEPRPNYFAVLLWNMLMGNTVYKYDAPETSGLHVYCHSRKDGKPGYACLIINNSPESPATVVLPKDAECYILTAPTLRSTVMELNGDPLTVDEDMELPDISPRIYGAGDMTLPSGSVMFAVL
ncbi:MAG: AI-2E family transporter [Eubacteriales bacterium]